MLTEQLIEYLNNDPCYRGVIVEFNDYGDIPSAYIKLPSYDGIQSANFYITTDAKNFITYWFKQRNITIEWNKSNNVFWEKGDMYK